MFKLEQTTDNGEFVLPSILINEDIGALQINLAGNLTIRQLIDLLFCK